MPSDLIERVARKIAEDMNSNTGSRQESLALAWDGYIAALLEWDVISVGSYDRLSSLLPKIEDHPVLGIFLGREDDE